MTTTKRVHLRLSGVVQGVWFRAGAEREARRLGLSGWVRNLVDGRVELVAEGEAPAVDELVRWAHRGPGAARVEAVEVREEEPAGEGGEFEVRPTPLG
jgi:acylphosphatase